VNCKSCQTDLTAAELAVPKLIEVELCFDCYVESISGSEVAEE